MFALPTDLQERLMNDSSQGEPPEPLVEAPGANGAADGDSADSPETEELSGLEELQDRIAVLSQELTDAKDLARRAQADLANVRRRARNERAEFRSRATEEVCSALLPVLDDLHRAALEVEKTTGRWDGDGSQDPAGNVVRGLLEGIRLVLRRFQDTLKRQGLLEIEAAGAPFDPRVHEAVQEIPAGPGQREGDVTEVLRRGYLLDGRVIRPATVIVAGASAEPAEVAEETGEGGSDQGDEASARDPAAPGSAAESVSA
ncbi:MAG: nucleotide exchange factor GrpE [Acidobacteria bacterium]|nr:nucleotide exchange factor GrpE [Acidobacteriota bacterium]